VSRVHHPEFGGEGRIAVPDRLERCDEQIDQSLDALLVVRLIDPLLRDPLAIKIE